MDQKYQLTIVGGGPGGYLAALRAKSLGLKTALIEKEALGGICLNHGCIPTKVLTHGAALYRRLDAAKDYGFQFDNLHFSYPRLQEKKKAVVSGLTGKIRELLNKRGISVFEGTANVLSPGKISIILSNGKETAIDTAKIILATGSEEIYPPTPGLGLPGILTSREALEMKELPRTMAVIGGGVIALEMASIYSGLGVEVTIVHRSERLLRRMDLEVVRRLSSYMRRKGVKIMMSSPIRIIEKIEGGYKLTVSGPKGEEIVQAEKVLLAVGRKAAFGGQDLESLGVDYDRSGIKVNSKMETSALGIYAAGDAVSPGYFLAHTAYHQGIIAAENAAGSEAHFDGTAVPSCLFTDPEYAAVGLSEEEALEKGYEKIKTAKFPFSANGKAATTSETDGLVKIIAAGTDQRLIGMHILGDHASDLIQEGTLALAKGATAADIARLIHPHPTMSESIWEAGMTMDKTALHFGRR